VGGVGGGVGWNTTLFVRDRAAEAAATVAPIPTGLSGLPNLPCMLVIKVAGAWDRAGGRGRGEIER
jgi:hypothetical protein